MGVVFGISCGLSPEVSNPVLCGGMGSVSKCRLLKVFPAC